VGRWGLYGRTSGLRLTVTANGFAVVIVRFAVIVDVVVIEVVPI